MGGGPAQRCGGKGVSEKVTLREAPAEGPMSELWVNLDPIRDMLLALLQQPFTLLFYGLRSLLFRVWRVDSAFRSLSRPVLEVPYKLN
jgi:hypothetical protein